MDSDEPHLTVEGLVRFFSALSTGALPTQHQLSAFLTALLASPLLNTEAEIQQTAVSGQGRKIVEALSEVLEAFRQLADEKNADDKLQRFLSATVRVEAAAVSNVPSTSAVKSDLDPAEDVQRLLASIRTTVILVFTSSTLRRLVGETFGLVLELLFEARDVAVQAVKKGLDDVTTSEKPGDKAEEVLKEATEQGPAVAEEKAQEWFDRNFPEQPEDALVERLQELVQEIKSDDRFVVAIDTFADILNKYIDSAKVGVDKTESATEEVKGAVGEVISIGKECLAAFLGKDRLDDVIGQAHALAQGVQEDEDLSKAKDELLDLLNRLVHDPKYASSQKFARRFKELRRTFASAASRQSESFRSALSGLQTNVEEAKRDVAADDKVKAFLASAGHFAKVVAGASGGGAMGLVKGPLQIGDELFGDLTRYWLGKAFEMLRLIALPRFEFVNPEWDVAVDGFELHPPDTGFHPSLVRLTNLSDFAIRTSNHSSGTRKVEIEVDPAATSYTRFQLRGLRGFAKQISTYAKRKQGWLRFEEEGYEDIVLGMGEGEGLNIDIEVGLRKDGDSSYRTKWDVRRAEVKLEGFAIYARSVKHPILIKLALPAIQSQLRLQLEQVLESLVRSQLDNLERLFNAARDHLEEARKLGRNADTWTDWIALLVNSLGQSRKQDEPKPEQTEEADPSAQASTELRRAGIVRKLPDNTRLAFGFEAQLLPGKATPVARRKEHIRQEATAGLDEAQRGIEQARQTVKESTGRVLEAVQEGRETRTEEVEQTAAEGGVADRVAKDRWKSDAFDLR